VTFDGQIPYDSLPDAQAQALVRLEWAARISERLAKLDLKGEFDAASTGYVEADPDGIVHVVPPTP
jgi:hypothetical protein